MELGEASREAEASVDGLVCFEECGALAIFDRFHEDRVGVVMIDYHDVVVAITRWSREASSEV